MTAKKELVDTINDSLFTALANLHTIAIARVESVNQKTVDVRPVINRFVDGREETLPLFTKVPPIFMRGGSSYRADPIAAGDYCLLLITERCFDRWYSGQDFVAPAEARMHDYSDAFALCGISPLASAIDIPALITEIGDAFRSGNYEHLGDYDLSGNMDAGSYSVGGVAGWSGSFATGDMRTVTVVNGIITQVA